MKVNPALAILGFVLAFCSPAVAQSGCVGQAGAGKFCGNNGGSTGLPGFVTITAGNLAPIAARTILGNPTNALAVPVATGLPIGNLGIVGGTSNGLLYDNAGLLGNLATANNGVLKTDGSGVPSISSTLPSALSIPNPIITGSFTATGLVKNADLVNPSTTVNGVICTLGSSCATGSPVIVGTTAVSGGTSPGLLYNNAGIVGNTLNPSVNVVRAEGTGTPAPIVNGAIGVELGNNGSFNFIQTAVRPSFSYGSQDLQIFSGGSLIFNTGGANVHGGINQNGQFSITTDPGGQYTGLTVTQPSPTGNTATSNCALNLVYCLDTISIGQTTPESVAFPSVTVPTNAPTTSGAVLHFANAASIVVGTYVSDQTLNSAIPLNTYVLSKAGNDVTLTQSVTGTVASGHNILFVTPGNWVNGPTIVHQYGGPNITGGRQSFYLYSLLNGATNFGNGNNQYVGAVFNSQASTSDGGTGPALAVAKGGIFPLNTIAALNAGATNFQELGIEFDVSARAGSSVFYKNGLSIVALADDAGRGSGYDAALSISSQSSFSVGWKNGILFSAANNGHAVGADGCLICTQDSWTVAKGFSAFSYAITGAFLQGPAGNFAVDGPTGNIGTKGLLQMIGSSSGSVNIGPQAAAGSPTLFWPTTAGTLASSATSPVLLNSVTGIISCPTCLTGNQTITLSGDATGSGTTAITVINVNLPTGVTVAGNLLYTNIAAPGTPASGKDIAWTDSTDLRFHDKNASGVIGTTVVADAGAANNYISAISVAGAITKSRPTCSTLSDSAAGCTAATMTSTVGGLVPTPPNNTTTFLRGDGTFASVVGADVQLTNAHIFVGNAGNVAADVAMSGDVSIANTGATTLVTAQPAVHTWALAQTFTVAPVFTDQSGSRTALGLGTMATQNASAVAITGGTIAGLTGLAIRDTSAAFDVTIAAVSGTTLTAGRTLTLNMGNVAHTLALGTTANTITFPNLASFTVITNGDTGTVTNAMLATMATNTIKGNATSGSASPTDLAIGSCSTASSALIWTTNTGFSCNTSITANAVPAANLTGATLASGVTASSLTSLGTITSLTATTINAFTLGGTISGGGNNINNVIIGAVTPLAGSFTTIAGAGNLSVVLSQNAQLSGNISNSNAGSGAYVSWDFVTNAGQLSFLNGSTASAIPAIIYSTHAGEMRFSAQGTAGFLTFQTGTGGVEQMRLAASGGLSVGTTTDPGVGSMILNAQMFMPNVTSQSTAASGSICWTTGTGKFTVDTTLACLTSSARFKNIIGEIPGATSLDIVNRLRTVSFTRKKEFGGDTDPAEQFGFTAEQAASVDERLISRGPDSKPLGVRYMEFTSILAGAVQQLKADNDNFESRLAKLENRK